MDKLESLVTRSIVTPHRMVIHRFGQMLISKSLLKTVLYLNTYKQYVEPHLSQGNNGIMSAR